MNKYGIGIGGQFYTFEFIDSFSISDSSTVTEFPIVTKSLVADHKFSEPRTITLSGSTSNANTKGLFPSLEKEEVEGKGILYNFKYRFLSVWDRLIEKTYSFFSDVKEGNLFIDIFAPNWMMQNCLLTNIEWTNKGESADFSLTFREVKFFNIEIVSEKVVEPDPNLPDLTDAIPQSAIETLLLKNTYDTNQIIYEALSDKKLIDEEFLRGLGMVGVGLGILVVGGAIIAGLIIAGGPVGWIIVAGAAVLGLIVFIGQAIAKFFTEFFRKQKYVEAFKYYSNKDKMEKEVIRYKGMVEQIHGALKNLNRVISAYTFSSNVAQEMLVDINGEYYTIHIKKERQESSLWQVKLVDLDNKDVVQWQDLSAYNSFYSCTNDNAFYTNGVFRMYFVYERVNEVEPSINLISQSFDLTKMTVAITDYDLDGFKKTIAEIAVNEMKRKK